MTMGLGQVPKNVKGQDKIHNIGTAKKKEEEEEENIRVSSKIKV